MTMRRPERVRALFASVAATALLLLGSVLSLWTMTLYAPQYPSGLRLVVDGRGASGDVGELNALNHYIGMPEIQQEAFPEMRLFTPGVVALAIALLAAAWVPWRAFRSLVVLGSWSLPLAFLTDLQWRLYQFGHSLNPEAAFRLPAFTPRVLGPSEVMNFRVTAWPGPGLALFVLSAAVFAFGPRFGPRPSGSRPALAPAVTGLVLALTLAIPAGAAGAEPAFDLTRAVAAAPAGTVIDVPPGRYEGPLVVARPIHLRGGGRAVIDGGRRGDVVVITANDVRLEGFVIRGSALAYSSEAAGVVVQGARAVVRANRIEDVLFGIYLAGAEAALIEGNTIAASDLPVERRGHALYLWKTQGTRITGNRIVRGKDGIYVSFSDDNIVERNVVSNCRYGIHYMYASRNVFRENVFRDNMVGAAVMYSADVTLVANTFEGSRSIAAGAGLIFKDADRLQVLGNRIVRNRVGLEFDNTPASIGGWARVEGNFIAFNEIGLGLMSTAAITVTENTVVENLRPVAARGAVRADGNRWLVDGRGNYWGDYAGFDASGDGVGDIPYRRNDALEELSARAPVLQAFFHTPAHQALEAATRLVPFVSVAPVVEDRAPLMRPPAVAPGQASRTEGAEILWISVALLLPACAALTALWTPRKRP